MLTIVTNLEWLNCLFVKVSQLKHMIVLFFQLHILKTYGLPRPNIESYVKTKLFLTSTKLTLKLLDGR